MLEVVTFITITENADKSHFRNSYINYLTFTIKIEHTIAKYLCMHIYIDEMRWRCSVLVFVFV